MPLEALPPPDDSGALAEQREARLRQVRESRRRARAARWRIVGAAVTSSLHEVVRTAVALGGAAMLSYGAWLAWRPAGFIAGGVLLIAGLWLHDRAGGT